MNEACRNVTSTQQSATKLSAPSVIKHYKKQLIYRQKDDKREEKCMSPKTTELEDNSTKEEVKKVRRKRKNKICRGQFRHEAMELIKLGTSASHTLCKAKDTLSALRTPTKTDSAPSVIKPIASTFSPPSIYAHQSLPQMVPEQRDYRAPVRVPVIYKSPPPPPRPPEIPPYRFPPYPFPTVPPLRPVSWGIHIPVPRYPVPNNNNNNNENFSKKKRKIEEAPVVAAIDLTVDHKCQCECGKRVGSERNRVAKNNKTSEVTKNDTKTTVLPPASTKLPQLFLIDDLLAKGAKIEKPKTNGHPVIVNPKVTESKDYNISDSRRRSVDIDTISISSSGSESVKSPTPKPNERQIPRGKLFYYKNNNSFIRYFEDTQKKLFLDNISPDGPGCQTDDKQVIELPPNASFNSKDNLTVEEYVLEMTQVEQYAPRDFYLFYKFVTGYQICNNNLPVSFLTFLKVYNTNGLEVLLDRYIASLKD